VRQRSWKFLELVAHPIRLGIPGSRFAIPFSVVVPLAVEVIQVEDPAGKVSA